MLGSTHHGQRLFALDLLESVICCAKTSDELLFGKVLNSANSQIPTRLAHLIRSSGQLIDCSRRLFSLLNSLMDRIFNPIVIQMESAMLN